MIKLLILSILTIMGSTVASDIDHVQALFESPWSNAGDPPDWLQLLSDMQRISQVDLTLEEWVVVLGHGQKCSRGGSSTYRTRTSRGPLVEGMLDIFRGHPSIG